MERVELPKVGSRERMPDVPNFRDNGRTIDGPLLALLSRLQVKHGSAWASEGGLRRMVWQDTGLCPGVTTVQKSLVRLGRQGLLVQVWLRAGQVTPDGGMLSRGTRLVWLPQGRRQKSAARKYNARQNRRAGHETRMTGHQASELVKRLAAPPASLATPRIEGDPHARERDRQLAELAVLASKWKDDDPPDR